MQKNILQYLLKMHRYLSININLNAPLSRDPVPLTVIFQFKVHVILPYTRFRLQVEEVGEGDASFLLSAHQLDSQTSQRRCIYCT